MRIHAVHLKGLRFLPGEHRLDLDPGYNLIVAGTAAPRLAELLVSLFHCDDDLRDGAFGVESRTGTRVDLSLAFGADAYRLILDLEHARVVLARYDAATRQYARVGQGAQVSVHLGGLGLPERAVLRTLHCHGDASGASAAAEAEAASELTPEERERLKLLRDARERLARIESDLESATRELGRKASLASLSDDFDVRAERYRAQSELRAREMAAVERSRRLLLDERNQLRGVPRAQRSGLWLGLALTGSGTLAGALLGAALYGIALAGLGLAGFFWLATRIARRRLGRLEARLSALRVKERSVEQSFDLETRDVIAVLEALGLRTLDDLKLEVADYRGLLSRVEQLSGDRDEARRLFSRAAQEELEELERFAVEGVRPLAVGDAPPRRASPWVEPDPELLLRAAERASGRPAADIRERLAPSLPLYLRLLSDAHYTQMRRGDDFRWYVRRDDQGELRALDDLADAELAQVTLAFRLAILEGLAPTLRLPLLLGPQPGSDAKSAVALARALRRLSGVIQVVQVVSDADVGLEHAARVIEVP
jgi:hypothetical protein